MLALLLAAVSMACRDMLATFMTVAEARGRSWLAGACDALGDLAAIAVTVQGAGPVIRHGITGHAIAVIATITATSFFGTALWTRLAQRIGTDKCSSTQPPPNRGHTLPNSPQSEVGFTTSHDGGLW